MAKRSLKSATDIRRYLSNIMHELKAGELTESKARTLAYIASIMLQAIDKSDIEARLDELERLMEGRKAS